MASNDLTNAMTIPAAISHLGAQQNSYMANAKSTRLRSNSGSVRRVLKDFIELMLFKRNSPKPSRKFANAEEILQILYFLHILCAGFGMSILFVGR